jgi:hypothetical protein
VERWFSAPQPRRPTRYDTIITSIIISIIMHHPTTPPRQIQTLRSTGDPARSDGLTARSCVLCPGAHASGNFRRHGRTDAAGCLAPRQAGEAHPWPR